MDLTEKHHRGCVVKISACALLALFLGSVSAPAQELEPRAYRAVPIGLQFVALSYSFSSGNVLVDPTIPVEDLELDINTIGGGYFRTFSFFGRAASAAVVVPYVIASGSATIEGEPTVGSRSDWGDARVRMSVNLVGGPAMQVQEFVKHQPGRNLGVGLIVSMPTGQYGSDLTVNFGANRWGFKPEIGYSTVHGPWILEATLGAWFFTTNTDGPGGVSKSQDPIGSLQGHLSYNFKNNVWIGVNANFFRGGQSTTGGREGQDLQENSRFGATVSVPLAKRHSLKLSAHTGAYTRSGADFDIGTIMYQVRLP